jgi:hypothetical protein
MSSNQFSKEVLFSREEVDFKSANLSKIIRPLQTARFSTDLFFQTLDRSFQRFEKDYPKRQEHSAYSRESGLGGGELERIQSGRACP